MAPLLVKRATTLTYRSWRKAFIQCLPQSIYLSALALSIAVKVTQDDHFSSIFKLRRLADLPIPQHLTEVSGNSRQAGIALSGALEHGSPYVGLEYQDPWLLGGAIITAQALRSLLELFCRPGPVHHLWILQMPALGATVTSSCKLLRASWTWEGAV